MNKKKMESEDYVDKEDCYGQVFPIFNNSQSILLGVYKTHKMLYSLQQME